MTRTTRLSLDRWARGARATPIALWALTIAMLAARQMPAQAAATDWANLARYRDANAQVGPPKAGEDRVVFYGNSITEGWAPLFATMFPGKPYVGRGISGQTTPQMLVRFRQDVVALKPKVVVILAGTNDIAGNTGPSTIEMIEDNLAGMTEIARANGIRVVLCSVLPVYDYPWKPGLEPAPKIVALNAWMKQYAASVGETYLDYHSAMKDARDGLPPELAKDGVHPTQAGYEIMARLVEPAIALDAQATRPLDVLLVGGRVMDPESGLDAIRNVGVRDGRIVAVTTARPAARQTVDVTGLVVAPGFIDLHSHGQDSAAYGYYARDGVTTALELELGTYPVAPWYAARAGKARINFGVAAGHAGARDALIERDSVHEGAAVIYHAGPWARDTLRGAALQSLIARIEHGLDEGGLGVGMGLQYSPGAGREEVLAVFEAAARHRAPMFVHIRSQGNAESGGSIDALQEVLADAAVSGASLHMMHAPSMGLGRTPMLLDMIARARSHGLDVTTEAYPYTAGQTALQSALFDPGWQQRLGIGYHELLWPATGERLTAESFERYRKVGGNVVLFVIPDSVIDRVYRDSLVIVASDAGEAEIGHPRRAGTHARMLGVYVRERQVMTLMDAIRKMTLLPARRLETVAPDMRRKGRVRVGADADLTVFDPRTVVDRATYDKPNQYSEGIRQVLVGGSFVVRDGRLVEGAVPGRAVRGIVK